LHIDAIVYLLNFSSKFLFLSAVFELSSAPLKAGEINASTDIGKGSERCELQTGQTEKPVIPANESFDSERVTRISLVVTEIFIVLIFFIAFPLFPTCAKIALDSSNLPTFCSLPQIGGESRCRTVTISVTIGESFGYDSQVSAKLLKTRSLW
jgi:hypothetical protein